MNLSLGNALSHELEAGATKFNFVSDGNIAAGTNLVNIIVLMVIWRSGSVFSINEVNLRWARLVVGCVTVSGFNFR